MSSSSNGSPSQAVAGQSVPKRYVDFFTEFYKRSDAPDHDAYLALLEPDVKFEVYAPRNGHDEIRAAREASLTALKNSKHRVQHIMLAEPEVAFVTGDVGFDRTEDGAEIRNLPFVARFTFSPGVELKVKEYYVWVRQPPVRK